MMFLAAVISLIAAFAILQGVTAWHKKEVGKAIILVAGAIFMSMFTILWGVQSVLVEFGAQLPAIIEQHSPELIDAIRKMMEHNDALR